MSRAARDVWVRNLTDPHVTYHARPTGMPKRDDGKYRTYCGLVMWNTAKERMEGAYIRTQYAEMIGKPCTRCFEVTP